MKKRFETLGFFKDKSISITVPLIRRPTSSFIMPLLYILSEGNAQTIITDLQNRCTTIPTKRSQYKLISQESIYGFQVQCKSCKTIFWTTKLNQRLTQACPHCQKSTQHYIGEMIRYLTNGDYELIPPLTSLNEPVNLHHHTCKNETTISKLSLFLFNNVRCSCEQMMTQEQAQKLIDKKGFQILEYTGFRKPARILHVQENHEFSVPYFMNFIRSCSYPICHPDIRKMDQQEKNQIFQERLNQLTNGEYILEGDYAGTRSNVTLKHTLCGASRTYSAENFLYYHSRCPCQRKEDNWIIKAVETLSNNKYSAWTDPDDSSGKTIIVRNNTIRSRKKTKISRGQLIKKLNETGKLDSNTFINTTKKGIQILKTCFPGNELIFMNEAEESLKKAGIEPARMNKLILAVDSIEYVFLQKVYRWTQYTYSQDEIIEKTYIMHHGTPSGYYTLDSFLYKIGAIPKPQNYHLASSYNTGKVYRKNLLNGIYVISRSPLEAVTTENQDLIEITDFIKSTTTNLSIWKQPLQNHLKKLNLTLQDFQPFLHYLPKKRQAMFEELFETSM